MKGKKVDIDKLADFILYYSLKNDIQINHLKLQKLLYYIQAWHLVYFEKNPLFDEVPEAWVNGPVYRKVYDNFKELGIFNNIGLIDKYKDNLDTNFETLKSGMLLDDDQWEFINAIFQHYGLMSHEKLVFLTHSEEPWNIARNGLNEFEYSDNKIEFDCMYDFYKKRLESKKK